MAAPARAGKRLDMKVTWCPSFSASPFAALARGLMLYPTSATLCSICSCGVGQRDRTGSNWDSRIGQQDSTDINWDSGVEKWDSTEQLGQDYCKQVNVNTSTVGERDNSISKRDSCPTDLESLQGGGS